MVHGIRPDVPDSLICVTKSFLMNTDLLCSFFFFTARVGCRSVCLAGLRQHRLFYCLLWYLRPCHMSEFPPLTAKATPVPTHIKATWLKTPNKNKKKTHLVFGNYCFHPLGHFVFHFCGRGISHAAALHLPSRSH